MRKNEIPNQEEASAVDSAELTLKDIIRRNQFKENDSLLDLEIQELESLYAMSKKYLLEEAGMSTGTGPKRLGTVEAGRRKNFMFISTQTANLISMRKLKMDLVKQKADLKRDELDRSIKTLVQISKDDKSNEEENSPSKILDFIINNLNVNIPMASAPRLENEDEVDSLLDAALGVDTPPPPAEPAPKKKDKKKNKPTRNYRGGDEILVYSQGEDKTYLATEDYEVIREMDAGEISPEFLADGSLVDAATNSLIEIVE